MKNEMTLDKTGLTIPASELAECGMAGVDLSAQMTHSLLLLMPREMTALQTADALAGLFDAASQLVSALLDTCRMPCCKNCDSDVREFDLDAVPAPIRKLLLDSGCCPALLECYLEEGDVVYAAEGGNGPLHGEGGKGQGRAGAVACQFSHQLCLRRGDRAGDPSGL